MSAGFSKAPEPAAPPDADVAVRQAPTKVRDSGKLRDDRWPDRFAAAMFLFAAIVLLSALVAPLRRYFSQPDDALSLLTIPIVPNAIYASLLAVVGVALLRRLRAAWWVLVVWFLILPELSRLVGLLRGEATIAALLGFVLMGGVLVLAVRAKPQFAARGVPGNALTATLAFVVGGFITLLVGAVLVNRFGSSPDLGTAGLDVLNRMLGDIGLTGDGIKVTTPLWVTALVGLLGATTVLGSAYLLFRAPKHTHTLDAAGEARVRTMLRQFGDGDSLGYFATRRDKSVIWDSGDPATARAGFWVQRSTTPNSCARSRLAIERPQPTTSPTSPTARSARARDPPISPTPITARRSIRMCTMARLGRW